MTTVRIARPEQVRVGQQHRERKYAQDRHPDHELPAEAVADGPAQDGACGHRAEEDEQVELRRAHRHAELADQIKRVVAAEARQVEILGEDQGDEHADRHEDATPRQTRTSDLLERSRCGRPNRRRGTMLLIPAAHLIEHDHRQQRDERAPGDAQLAARQHEECREQRAHGRSDIPADLEHRLRHAVPSAGCHARDARRLGVKDGRADADESSRQQQRSEAARHGQEQQPDQENPMPATSEYGVWCRSV